MRLFTILGGRLGKAGRDQLQPGCRLGDYILELREIERCGVELTPLEHAQDALGDVERFAIAELADAAKIDDIDIQLAVVAAQHIGALAADAEDLDLLALRQKRLDALACEARDIGIERAGEAPLGRHHDKEMGVLLAGADEKRRGAFLRAEPGVQIGKNGVHPLGIGARGDRRLLGAPQFCRRNHLHGLGDLPRRLHGGDAVAEVFQTCHCAPRLPLTVYAAKFLANVSSTPTSFLSMSEVISFFDAISARISEWLSRRWRSSCSSNFCTAATGSGSR